MFKIGDFSRICCVPASMLRYYADIGLLEPAHVDSTSGYRYYTLDQLPRLNRILALKDLGLSLPDIGRYLDDNISPETIREMLQQQENELQEEVRAAQERLRRVQVRLRQIEKHNQVPKQDVVIRSITAQPTLAIREVIPLPEVLADVLRESGTVIYKQHITLAAPPMTIFHDPEFKDADLDIEIAFPLQADANIRIRLRDDRYLTSRILAAIPTAACTLHIGGYDSFSDSYTALGQWIDANGYHVTGQPREIYLRPPGDEPAVTEIQMPIGKL